MADAAKYYLYIVRDLTTMPVCRKYDRKSGETAAIGRLVIKEYHVYTVLGSVIVCKGTPGFIRRKCSLESLRSMASADFPDLRRNKSARKFCIISSLRQT